MEIKTANFLVSNSNAAACPKPDRPEYAFIGRSNVGKSSLINMLTDRKKLAKTSGTPGKTQLINHFWINEIPNKPDSGWYLVDLPGYGYAKVSKKMKTEFQGLIYDYLKHRENLMCVFVLIDSRHFPQKNDLEFMEWLGTYGIPFVIVFTKADKISATQLDKNISIYKKEMLKTWEEVPQNFASSSETGKGKEDILQFIEETNALYYEAY